MNALTQNWFTEGLIDFEYKKYTLLAYLRDTHQLFEKGELYPHFADLVWHYNNLVHFKYNKDNLKNLFPERLNDADLSAMKLNYQKLIEDDALMLEIEDIVNYSIDSMTLTLDEGRNIYEHVEKNITIAPIGLQPLENSEGYFIIKTNRNFTARIFTYKLGIYESAHEKFRGINTTFIGDYALSISNTFENIKLSLMRTHHLPNPAVYAVICENDFPLKSTLLPVTCRTLVKFIS